MTAPDATLDPEILTLLRTHAQALEAARLYIDALEEELGHQGTSTPEGEQLRGRWLATCEACTEAVRNALLEAQGVVDANQGDPA